MTLVDKNVVLAVAGKVLAMYRVNEKVTKNIYL